MTRNGSENRSKKDKPISQMERITGIIMICLGCFIFLYAIFTYREWYILEIAFLLAVFLILFGYQIGFSIYKLDVQRPGGRRYESGAYAIDEQTSTDTLEISEVERLSMNRFFKLCFFLIFGGFIIAFLGMFIHPYFGYFVFLSAVGIILMFLGFFYIIIKYRAYFSGKQAK